MIPVCVTLKLPAWVKRFLRGQPALLPRVEDRMRLVVELARRNVARGTGGPFAAAVYELKTGRLIAAGVNVVVPATCSLAHAEMMALALAQRALGRRDLGERRHPACELVTSVEPCAMCLGATPWSGVRRLVCGARDGDARAAGFDEGDKPANWVQKLRARGIDVERDVCRADAARVLGDYQAVGGVIYNGRGISLVRGA